ncbi:MULTISPECIES: glycoside hydrolase family 75 protein [unclassified Variovorax]|nr:MULTISPECIES: glycoside hydrolase family 75 protein [unclassified Variovorax]
MNSAGAVALALTLGLSPAFGADCEGSQRTDLGNVPRSWVLTDGGIAAFAKMNINIDGYARAYHPKNAAAGALIHLCNAGRPYLPDGTSYNASEDNQTCTGRFMQDFERIGAAGWKSPSVGAINWFGILGTGSVKVGKNAVSAVVPVKQKDGSGFYVSPTALADETIADKTEQSRYVNPLRVPAGVVPKTVIAEGVKMGSFGVAYNVNRRIAVPFVVGDAGPRIGEASVALARLAAGLPLKDDIKRSERYAGQVDTRDVLWVYFKDASVAYDHKNEAATVEKAKAAYQAWGGDERLALCVQRVPRN